MATRNKESDTHLLERVRLCSDKDAYCSLYSKYYPILVAYAEMFVRIEDAEDIVQDHLLKLWTRRESLDSMLSLNSYLFACVRNSCLDKIRHSKIHNNVTELWASLAEEATDCGCHQIMEIRAIIRNALNELPSTQRRAFEMSRFEGKTYRNIASIMGVSQKTVEYRISRALEKLSSALSDYLPSTVISIILMSSMLNARDQELPERFSDKVHITNLIHHGKDCTIHWR